MGHVTFSKHQRFLYSRKAWSVSRHKTCHNGNRLVQVLMKPCLKQGCHFHIGYVDHSLHRNNRTRYSRKTGAKTDKLPWKETKICETQASLQSPKCLGTQTSVEKNIFFLGKLYSSHRASAFGNPLVQDTRVLISDGWTSGSFLPWHVDWLTCKTFNTKVIT